MALDLGALQHRAQLAKETLENEGFQEALQTLRALALLQFERSDPNSPSIRDDAYWQLRGIRALEEVLQRMITDHNAEAKRQTVDKPNRTLKL